MSLLDYIFGKRKKELEKKEEEAKALRKFGKDILQKRKSPEEVIEKGEMRGLKEEWEGLGMKAAGVDYETYARLARGAGTEQSFLKLPRRNLINVSAYALEDSVGFDYKRIEKTLKEAGKSPGTAKYAILHTHLGDFSIPLPSKADIRNFLTHNQEKTMFIAEHDAITNKVKGYCCIRKTKRTKSYTGLTDEVARINHSVDAGQKLGRKKWKEGAGVAAQAGLKHIAKKNHLRFRFVPVKGYTFSKKKGKFVKKEKELEERLVAAAVLFIILIFFMSSNITGNIVTNLNSIGSSFLINFILICVLGLVCYLYLK